MKPSSISFVTKLVIISFHLLSYRITLGEKVGDDVVSAQSKIVDWVRSNGGYFSDKQEFRLTTDNGNYGMFATQDIKEGELLCSVPWNCIITGTNMKKKDKRNPYFFCGSTRRLIDEITSDKKSFYEPYVSYLMQQPRGVIPSDWSTAGKELLLELLGDNQLPPNDAVSLIDIWEKSCYQGDDNIDKVIRHRALVEYHTRADDEILIPLYDLYNHGQDKNSNGITEVFWDNKQDVRAARDIKVGEEIAMSYNFGIHQSAWTKKYYGTPDFLRDYGFVEAGQSQRWTFTTQGFGFDLKRDENNSLKLTWLKQPNTEVYLYLTEQLERLTTTFLPKLKNIEERQQTSGVPLREITVIRQYFDAIAIAIWKAINVWDATNANNLDHADTNDDDDWDDDEHTTDDNKEGDEHYFDEL